MRVERFLDELAGVAFERAMGERAPAILRPTSDPKHGDYQVNGVMPLAKQQKKNPRELAEPVAAALRDHEAIAKAEVAGPGFVNVTLAPQWIGGVIARSLGDAREGVPPVETKNRIVVDYSSPNIAKQMHVGHLRSTILGHAICELLAFIGHDVIRDNHVGDWGTQYGLLIAGLRRFRPGDEGASLALDDLESIYKQASQLAETDTAFADAARAELAKLQKGDPENRALWERFVAITRVELDRMYERLGVRFDHWLGESAYDPMLEGVARDLEARGLARRDQGALCIFFGDEVWAPFSEGGGAPEKLRKQKEPYIVQKKDGAYLYATSDLACIAYRRDHFHADRAVYVVDVRQSLHFEQLFAVARKLGHTMGLTHVGFGTILGTDGKPLKTRDASGKTVPLSALLDEAERRALALMQENGVDLPPHELPIVARAIGSSAVKYADLKQNRTSDYQFDWSKLVALQGNCGPYIQYAAARAGSIFRKGEIDERSIAPTNVVLEAPQELSLARTLIRFPDVVHMAAETYQPHLLTDHLYSVASELSSFYEACPVLKSEGVTRESRLALVALAGRQLRRGLRSLGLDVIERM
jgi:arginyl-tRNA synthetase